MAIDQRDVSSTLRFMDDRALQQYAVMHKNDPYIFPLAFQESQNRQKLRMGQQGAQGMPQPKVTDQALAQMSSQRAPQMSPQMSPQMFSQMGAQPMPEDQGIARLPVGNMDFAEGGIVAFSNGGDTEEATSPFGDAARGMFGRIRDFSLEGEANRQFANMNPADKITQLQSERARIQQRLFEPLTPTERQARSAEMQAIDQEIAALASAAAQPAAAPVEPVPEAGLGALVDPSAAPPAVEQQSMGAGPAPVDDQGIMSLLDRLGETQREGEMAASEIERRGMETRRADLEAAAERAKTSGSDREERLKKREEGMKGDKESNINMTLIEAGLAMMAGQSPNALLNIAQGAQQGLKGYQGRLDKINTNKEKLDEDYARLYEIREAKVEASGDRLSQLGLEETALQADAHRRLFNIGTAITGKKIEYKIGKDKAADAFRNAQAGSQTPERQAFADILRKNDGDAVAALTEFNEKFGKQPGLPSYILKELETIGQERAKLLASGLPEEMTASSLAQLDARQQALLNISSRSGGASSIPKAAIDMLQQNPTEEAKRQFDSAFNSPGAADRALAGK